MSGIKLIVACLAVAALFLSPGCSKDESQKLTKEQVAEQMIAKLKSMAEAMSANAGDCDAMDKALMGIMSDVEPLKARGAELQKDPEVKKWFDEEGTKMLEPAMDVIFKGLAAAGECKDKAGVQKAIQAIQ